MIKTDLINTVVAKLEGKLIKETLWSFANKAIVLVLFFLINIYLARKLGVEKYGLWSFFLSIFSVILLFSEFGINASSRKYIAQDNETDNLRTILSSSLKLRVLTSLIFSFLLLLISKPLATWIIHPELHTLFLCSVPLVFFSGLVEFLKSTFTGLHRIKYVFLVNAIEYSLKFLLIMCFFVFSIQMVAVVKSYIFAAIISSTIGLLFLYFRFYKGLHRSRKSYLKKIFQYSLPLVVCNLGFIIFTESDSIMLGMLQTDREVGIYAVSKQIIVKLPHISLAIIMGVMPVFAKMNNENVERLKSLFLKLLKINTIIFSIISLLIVTLAWFFIPLVYGADYNDSILPLQLLVPFLLSLSYSAYVGTLLDYQGLAKKRALNLTLGILLNISLNFILIPRYGASGAAISTSISYLPYFLLNCFALRKHFIWTYRL